MMMTMMMIEKSEGQRGIDVVMMMMMMILPQAVVVGRAYSPMSLVTVGSQLMQARGTLANAQDPDDDNDDDDGDDYG